MSSYVLATLKDMYMKALEMGVFLHRGPVWTTEGTLVCRGLRDKGEILSGDPVYWGILEIRKRRLWNRATLSIGAPLGNLEGGSCTGDFEREKYLGSFFLGSRGCQESKPGAI
jgi:hypothetical protein